MKNNLITKTTTPATQNDTQLTAEETLRFMIGRLLTYLPELCEVTTAQANYDFVYGERTAYTEVMEWMQRWEYAFQNGLDFDVEDRFPL